MHNELSRKDDASLARYLDRAEVLSATTVQLRKDLALSDQELLVPDASVDAFEALRGSIEPRLEELDRKGRHALQVAMYRVDIPEGHLGRTLALGGIPLLAGECVLRALQKVLTRMRYAGRY